MKKFLSALITVTMFMSVFAVFPLTAAADSGSGSGIPDITAHELVARMRTGWNLGNTFDAYNENAAPGASSGITSTAQVASLETSWVGGGNATSQSLIQELKRQGFDTLRIPVTWHKTADPNNNWQINSLWMARIKQVVDWAIAEDMYVILNTHHENRVLNLGTAGANSSTHAGNIFVTNIWRQIAEEFRDYDEKLIFAGLNEPRHEGGDQEWNGGTVTVRDNVNHLNQAFVDTVRASGGNNEDRFLLVPTVAAGSNNNSLSTFRVPLDLPRHQIEVGSGTNVGYGNTNISSSRIILAVHTYSPFNWAHDGLGTYAGALGIINDLNRVQNRANALGLPVILSEWGSIETARRAGSPVTNGTAEEQAVRNTQRPTHAEDYIREAKERGMVSVWWDNGGFGSGGHSFGIIRRNSPHNISDNHQNVIDAIMRGAGFDSNPCGNPLCRNPDCECENCDCGDMPVCLCEGSGEDIILTSLIGVRTDQNVGPARIVGTAPNTYWDHSNWERRIDNLTWTPNMLGAFSAIGAAAIEITLKITDIAPVGAPAADSNLVTFSPDITQMGAAIFRMNSSTFDDWSDHGSETMFTALNETITISMPTNVILNNNDQVGLQIFPDENLLEVGMRMKISYEITDARVVSSGGVICICLSICCVDRCRHTPSTEDCTVCKNCGEPIPGAEHEPSTADCMECKSCEYTFATASSLKPKCIGCRERCAPHLNREAEDCTVCFDCGIRGLIPDCDENNKCDSCLCAHIPGVAATCTTAQLCTACNRELVKETGHKAGEPATCTTTQVCINPNCTHVLAQPLGHNFGTNLNSGYHECKRDGCTERERCNPNTAGATCTACGYLTPRAATNSRPGGGGGG
ncbi:MAG: glycoside hydrolase family 5 protein, partial [Oscillospiraceae bacterium]|nr:glycoside hydrolase family 5 protein [Oscillospiraceae bacterium]